MAEKKKRKASEARKAKALARREAEADLAVQPTKAKSDAARLAQIVNLHIAGFSLAEIGASIGASVAEVDRLLSEDAARYVRTQPQLRRYVRNYISGRYSELLSTVWDTATDKEHVLMLDHQDRALRILDKMAKLHGAEAPVQSEVKVESAPEAVEKLVSALAAQQGLGYDVGIFDVVDAEVVEDAVTQSADALGVAGDEVEVSDGDDDL